MSAILRNRWIFQVLSIPCMFWLFDVTIVSVFFCQWTLMTQAIQWLTRPPYPALPQTTWPLLINPRQTSLLPPVLLMSTWPPIGINQLFKKKKEIQIQRLKIFHLKRDPKNKAKLKTTLDSLHLLGLSYHLKDCQKKKSVWCTPENMYVT